MRPDKDEYVPADGGGIEYDIPVDFDAIASNGVVFAPADRAKRDVILTPGAVITAGDDRGNRCPGRVVANVNGRLTLQLRLDRFQSARSTLGGAGGFGFSATGQRTT
jgi:hypothetical protein